MAYTVIYDANVLSELERDGLVQAVAALRAI